MRIGEKWLLFLEAIDLFIHALKIFRKKFKPSLKPKYIKRNFRLLKFLLSLFWEAVEVFWSLINEILRLKNILRFISNWRQLIILLMAESILITSAVYFLYLIFLVLLGIVLGFWVGVYNREEEIYVFTLLSLLEMLYKNRFNPVLLELWGDLSLEPNRVEYFSKLSLKTVEQIHPRPSKLILKEPDQRPQIPFPILGDPFIWINVNLSWEESKNYNFELFEFYKNVNEKVKPPLK